MIEEYKIIKEAKKATEENGIVFLDEIDKVSARSDRVGGDVSREGVQRDYRKVFSRPICRAILHSLPLGRRSTWSGKFLDLALTRAEVTVVLVRRILTFLLTGVAYRESLTVRRKR